MTLVLVVENNPELRENTVELLELSGYDVLAGSDGNQGLKLARERHPDLIIYDSMMLFSEVSDFLLGIGEGESTRSIPLLFLDESISQMEKLVSPTHIIRLQKPFTQEELQEAVSFSLSGDGL